MFLKDLETVDSAQGPITICLAPAVYCDIMPQVPIIPGVTPETAPEGALGGHQSLAAAHWALEGPPEQTAALQLEYARQDYLQLTEALHTVGDPDERMRMIHSLTALRRKLRYYWARRAQLGLNAEQFEGIALKPLGWSKQAYQRNFGI